jgi:DNA-binding NtrC family response regulator
MAEILVVEDDADAAEALSEALEYAGHTARVAHDGEQGLKRVGDRLPDLVLLDIEMPRLDGPDMAYRMFVRDLGQEGVPIILVSGVPDIKEVAARVGTPYFLPKPYTLEALAHIVERALAERTPPRPRLPRP